LFAPLDLGIDIGILPNRVIMGSMHTGLEGNSMPRWMLPLLGETQKHHHETEQGMTEQGIMSAMATYFAERAAGGVGLCVTGGIAPNRAGWTGPFSSKLTSEEEMRQHVVVTRAVHEQRVPTYTNNNNTNTDGDSGSTSSSGTTVPARICLQILHTGRYAYHPFAVSASSTQSPISPFSAQALSVRGIETTIRDFVHTAVLAKQAQYDGVEIMASEGYLLSQFMSPCTNHRTDKYGNNNNNNNNNNSVEDRARMALEIIRQTRAACGPDFIIIFRLSLLDLVPNGLSFDESVALCALIQDAGATILNTGIGWHEARVPTIATSVPRGAFAFTTIQLKQRLLQQGVDIPVCATNRINHPVTAEQVLTGRILHHHQASGADSSNSNVGADLVSMARPFLADARLLQKSRDGQEDEINTCIACNQACLDHVFVGKVASCLVNPRACHETELKDATLVENQLPMEHRLNIGVVGAGPAGCAFSITAAQLGHSVTLFDQDVAAIGGQFHMAKRIPGKEEFHETLRYFNTMLQKYQVNVQLNTRVDYNDMIDNKYAHIDKWINATGVNPRNPNIPGQEQATNVVSYIDVLKHKVPIGKRVAVIGAGGIGFDVSEYLLHWKGPHDKSANEVSHDDFYKEWGIDATLQARGGLTEPTIEHPPEQRQLYLIQRKKGKLGAGLGKTTGWIHRATLNNSGRVEMINGAKYEKIDEHGHLHISQTSKDGKTKTTTRVLEVDHIVICAGQVEKPDLQNNADTAPVALHDRLYTIGGAYEAGELDAKRAIDMGTRVAMKIHEPNCRPGNHVSSQPLPGVEEKLFSLLRRFM
jgi:2,4-dienoyl-CoA reductase (NADPH2)